MEFVIRVNTHYKQKLPGVKRFLKRSSDSVTWKETLINNAKQVDIVCINFNKEDTLLLLLNGVRWNFYATVTTPNHTRIYAP